MTSFDLANFIRNTPSPEVAAQMAQAVSFRWNVAFTRNVRGFAKSIHQSLKAAGLDTTDMVDALRAAETTYAGEKSLRDGGADMQACSNILLLGKYQENWQDLAAEMTGMTFDYQGKPRVLSKRPSIEDLLNEEIKIKVKPLTLTRIKTSVERRLAGVANAEVMKRVMDRRVEQEEMNARKREDAMNDQRDGLIIAYNLALESMRAADGSKFDLEAHREGGMQHDVELDEDDSLGFDKVHGAIQGELIQAALLGAERADTYASSSSTMTDTEYMNVLQSSMNAERKLRDVLAQVAHHEVSV